MASPDALRSFYDRRHPEYNGQVAHWAFLEETYEGGRAWFERHIFQGDKEGKKEFRQRKARAYRFNHTREVVDLLQKYLFKGEIVRDRDNAPEVVKKFWDNATLDNLQVEQLMRNAASLSSIKGRAAIVVDNNFREGAVSVAESTKGNQRIYAYAVDAKDVLDYAYDEDGDGGLLWVKIREYARDDKDPLHSTGDIIERIRLWTRNEWVLFEEEPMPEDQQRRGAKQEVVLAVSIKGQKQHNLGRVPVVLLDHMPSDNPYKVPGLIDDIAYLDRAVANYLSNLDTIIQDQTFSQLAMPAQGLLPGDDEYNKLIELSTKRAFIFDGGAGSTAKPEFLSPDPKQAGVILTVISKIINEIYHTVGLAGERTKEDNSQGIDNSSGVAKAYDFERVNSLLTTKGKACERAENEVAVLVCLWAKEKAPAERLVKYPETYDVMRLLDDLAVAEQLFKIDAPKEMRRQHLEQIIDKLFKRIKPEKRAKIVEDIRKWPENMEPVITAPPSSVRGTTPSRQGQVTKKTPAAK